ncbi:MAG: ISAs1 family transposase [Thermomicrobiales bacterium]
MPLPPVSPRSPEHDPQGSVGIAFDGKAQRGRLACADQPEYPVHMLSAVLHDRGIVLAQLPLDHTGEKAEAELTAAPLLVARLDWTGCVLTGDALSCHADVCETVTSAGGEYLLIVKENQATLLRAITTLFASRADGALRAASLPAWDMREVTTLDKGHGRIEVRHLVASTALNDYLAWPGLAQVVMVERHWWERGSRKEAVRYGITSLPAGVTDARRLAGIGARALADRERTPRCEGCDAGRRSQHDSQRQRAEHHGDPARYGRQPAAPGRMADDRGTITLLQWGCPVGMSMPHSPCLAFISWRTHKPYVYPGFLGGSRRSACSTV